MIDVSTKGKTVASTREEIAQLHTFEHWPARKLWPLIVSMFALSYAIVAVDGGPYWPWLFLIWPTLGTVIFVFVIAFHDASHDRLHPVHWCNEVFGHIVGTLMFIPLNVYRYAHARHHAYLATQGDPELWPFNTPGSSRVLRILAAFCEIVFGFIYSPLLFARCIIVGGLTREERKLILRGYAACFVVWAIILAAFSYYGHWRLLLVAGIVPMAISGIMQTLNKFTQHMGLHGETVLGLTRTVVDEHKAAELVSSTMFYNDYHGTHHRYAKIPYYNLPTATPYAVANASEFCPVYSNLAGAFVAMLPCLADPKVGPQWFERELERSPDEPALVTAADAL